MTYSTEILNAVGLLDRDVPGWHRRIDLAEFELGSCTQCVLGQVYGAGKRDDSGASGFGRKHQWFDERLGDEGAGVFRFGLEFGKELAERSLAYQEEWRSLIAERQEADLIGETLSISDVELDEVEGLVV